MQTAMMLFYDALEEYSRLTDEQFGRLIRAGLVYARDGEGPSFPSGSPEGYLFPGLRLKIDRDRDKYQDICEKRTAAAVKRWNQRPEMQLHTNACKSCQEKENQNQKENQKEKENQNQNQNAARAALVREGFTKSEIDSALAAADGQNGIRDLTAYARRTIQNERQKPKKTVIAQQYTQRDYSGIDEAAEADRKMSELFARQTLEAEGYTGKEAHEAIIMVDRGIISANGIAEAARKIIQQRREANG